MRGRMPNDASSAASNCTCGRRFRASPPGFMRSGRAPTCGSGFARIWLLPPPSRKPVPDLAMVPGGGGDGRSWRSRFSRLGAASRSRRIPDGRRAPRSAAGGVGLCAIHREAFASRRRGLRASPTPLAAAYREKLALLDSAIADLKANVENNRYNVYLQNQLASLYREKQKTLQEWLENANRN